MTRKAIIVVAMLFVLSGCNSVQQPKSGELDYSKQNEWEVVAGNMQSPIDIQTAEVGTMHEKGDLELEYEDKVLKVVNNGHAIEGELEGEAIINGRTFHLKQFHFHAQSEHTIDGKHQPLELHFVHQEEDGRYAVIGVLIEEGKENEAFKQVLAAVDKETAINSFDAELLLPENRSYYHYLGSLTTPPLAENVEWYVLKESIQVSKEQIEAFHAYYSNNSREVKPLNDRVVLLHEE